MGLAPVRDLREAVGWLGRRNWTELETDVLAGFVLARAAAGLSDATVSSDVRHLEQVRAWFGCPLNSTQRKASWAFRLRTPGRELHLRI